MPRSLRVRLDYTPKIKSSLLRNGFPSQKVLAQHLNIAPSTVSNFLNSKPVDYLNFIELCRVLGQEWRDVADLEKLPHPEQAKIVRAKVLISDRRTDTHLAQQLQQALSAANHNIIIAGEDAPLSEALTQCDYLILLLSPQSAYSELTLQDVQQAKELWDTSQKPIILPIFVDFPLSEQLSLPFDLLAHLEGVQAWQWHSGDNISSLGSAVLSVLQEGRISLPSDHELALNWTTITTRQKLTTNQPLPVAPPALPELPEGQVGLASPFYMERPPIEAHCYEAITKPGALIRIKAPSQMGKTSLMARILHYAEECGSRTVTLSLHLANQKVFSSSDTFLQWFCASVSLELGLLDSEQLAKHWQLAPILGSNQCCKGYFERYLLPKLGVPLTLGLDKVDRIFPYREIADDFFGLLRALHEEAKLREIWQNFRLIVVHSTEVFIPLDINKSPFNVGLPIELPEFTSQQVQELARQHKLNWQAGEVEQLMRLVGGHPYLVRLAMYHSARQDITLDRLVQQAPTESGLYSDHLRHHLWDLAKYPELMEAMRTVVTSHIPVRLPLDLALKLDSMGLVKRNGHEVTARCQLYAQYFQARRDAEPRQLTVMFCDLVGSTMLSEQLPPYTYCELLQAYHETCEKVILGFEGYIAQYLGDGILSYFCYPTSHEDDAYRAVKAGLEILAAIAQLNLRLKAERGISLAVRIGIHTGLVIVAEVGGSNKYERLAIGVTPNIAARLQGQAALNSVILSEATYRQVQEFFDCQSLGAKTLKGIAQPIDVYQVDRR
ncbi:AAA-like domain-containing protein [Allocoleopsis sp.]|uniref:AAA-like domain-containing protein n=1 Tax=Allocoleopsis sp. TaxID=3088169 RepID=UPI002FD2DEA0